MYAFQRAFKALDEVTVADPLGLGTRWTIVRSGKVETDKKGIGDALTKALGPVIVMENLPRRTRKRLEKGGGLVDLVREVGKNLDLDELFNSEHAIEGAVDRVRNIDPLEVVDDATGERKRVAFSRERAGELLRLTEPVPRPLVEATLPIQAETLARRDGEGEEEWRERQEEVREAHGGLVATITTLGAFLRAWVYRVSEDAQLYREGVEEEAGESSGPGPNGSPAATRT